MAAVFGTVFGAVAVWTDREGGGEDGVATAVTVDAASVGEGSAAMEGPASVVRDPWDTATVMAVDAIQGGGVRRPKAPSFNSASAVEEVTAC